MAHRGRLNVLANIVGKSYDQIFKEFEGAVDPESTQGSGDVKYHLGQSGKFVVAQRQGDRGRAVGQPEPPRGGRPGRRRHGARQAGPHQRSRVRTRSLPILVHGDAAFAGQGVVAETLQLGMIKGYRVGGTIHLVINNQLGFTTPPESARSSEYPTDIAKMVQAPIFHVNGDDPEACVRVARLAFAYRQRFGKDVVIDMICYRRLGHNEGDDPSYTQPIMYKRIENKRSVRKLYTESLVKRGDITLDEAEHALDDFQAKLQEALDSTRSHAPAPGGEGAAAADAHRLPAAGRDRRRPRDASTASTTCCRRRPTASSCIRSSLASSTPARRCSARTARSTGRWRRRWRSARCCSRAPTSASPGRTRGGARSASVTPCSSTTRPAPSGRRSRTSIPDQAKFWIYDSLLSEYAAVGFEYGYSVANKSALVAWEAQFGDFVNGAQIVIDQYLVAAEDKWGQTSGLVMLLPHGYEGQGPEHSSARIERFLTLCAEDNIQVTNCTTAAQYFHLLRRQMHRDVRKPLDRVHAEVAAAGAAGAFEGRGADAGFVPRGARRPDVRRRSRVGEAGRAGVREGRARRDREARRSRHAGRGAAGRAAVPVAVRAPRRGAVAVHGRPASSCGCRRSPRTWARGTSSRVGCTKRSATTTRSAASAASSPAAPPPAPTPSTSRNKSRSSKTPSSPASDPRPPRNWRALPTRRVGDERRNETGRGSGDLDGDGRGERPRTVRHSTFHGSSACSSAGPAANPRTASSTVMRASAAPRQ